MTVSHNFARRDSWPQATRTAQVQPGAQSERQQCDRLQAPASEAHLAAVAEREYASRRKREKLMPFDIFAEPGWDMLLDLYVQRFRKRPVSVNSLCIAAIVPQTTALRWIDKLRQLGLIKRERSTGDNRVVHVTLTAEGADHMEEYLRELVRQDAEADGQRGLKLD